MYLTYVRKARTYVRKVIYVNTYVRTYASTYVRTYVRTCVRTYLGVAIRVEQFVNAWKGDQLFAAVVQSKDQQILLRAWSIFNSVKRVQIDVVEFTSLRRQFDVVSTLIRCRIDVESTWNRRRSDVESTSIRRQLDVDLTVIRC